MLNTRGVSLARANLRFLDRKLMQQTLRLSFHRSGRAAAQPKRCWIETQCLLPQLGFSKLKLRCLVLPRQIPTTWIATLRAMKLAFLFYYAVLRYPGRALSAGELPPERFWCKLENQADCLCWIAIGPSGEDGGPQDGSSDRAVSR